MADGDGAMKARSKERTAKAGAFKVGFFRKDMIDALIAWEHTESEAP
jgi:hypothetical protein